MNVTLVWHMCVIPHKIKAARHSTLLGKQGKKMKEIHYAKFIINMYFLSCTNNCHKTHNFILLITGSFSLHVQEINRRLIKDNIMLCQVAMTQNTNVNKHTTDFTI